MTKMIKKSVMVAMAAVAMGLFVLPAQAQFGKLGKSLGKAAKDAGNAVAAAAGDMAMDAAATKVSTKVVEWMDKNNTVLADDNAYVTRLNNLVSKKYTTVDALALNYKVYENPEINLLGTADGSIRVYTGMMDALSDDELLAVIAVQIGHIANKDSRDALMKVADGDNASKASTAQLEKLLSLSGDKLGTVVNEFMQVPYTEDQSKSADTFAYDLLKKNGSNVAGLASALNKFAAMEAADTEAESAEDGEYSGAAKYNAVNVSSAVRASLISSK